jgi:hypothetical protein
MKNKKITEMHQIFNKIINIVLITSLVSGSTINPCDELKSAFGEKAG